MATTSRPISELATGIRTSADAVVASGKVRFYNPGTLVQATVYSDSACTTGYSQPITLNAAGQATVYTLEPVRMIVKDSTETTTYYDNIPNLNRHDAVYVTSPDINGGDETTLEDVLSSLVSSLGNEFQFKESSSATARDYADVIGELAVSVKDFAAVGDGSNDDTSAIQGAIDRVASAGGGRVYFPRGTYKITSALSITTANVNLTGEGPASVISNYGASSNAITVDVGAGVDSKMRISDIYITYGGVAGSTSATALSFTNGDRPVIERVRVALHRTGISTSAVADAVIRDCIVLSTDDNASAVGISIGSRGRVEGHCIVVSSTTNGTGVSGGADSAISGCYISKFATGISLAGANALAIKNYVASATTAFSVGAYARCSVVHNKDTGATTSLSVNASATYFLEHSNTPSATVTNSAASSNPLPLTSAVNLVSESSTSTSFTPDPTLGAFQSYENTSTSAVTLTLAATATASLRIDQLMILSLFKSGANGITVTWNSQYKSYLGTNTINATAVAQNTVSCFIFRWTGSVWQLVFMSSGANPAAA